MTYSNSILNKTRTILKTPLSAFLSALCLVLWVSSTPITASAAEQTPQAKKPAAQQVASKVDINRADAKSLADALNGVGLKKAEAIIAWREKFGKFVRVEQLTEVKGIGEKTLEKNRHLITL